MKQTASSPCSSPFKGKTFVLELGREIGFKAKQELINYLRVEQAYISYILTASVWVCFVFFKQLFFSFFQTDYVLVTNDVDTYKTRRAKQLGFPLVNVEYVYECRRLLLGKTAIDIRKFIIKPVEDQENFTKTGTIPIIGKFSSSFLKLYCRSIRRRNRFSDKHDQNQQIRFD